MNYNIITCVLLLCSSLHVYASGPFEKNRKADFAYDVDFEMNFDNREYDPSSFSRSRTIFGARLTPAVGLKLNERSGGEHRLMFGIDVMKDFGDSPISPSLASEGNTDELSRKKENLDHLVTIKEKKERIYPLSEHGRLLIGREGEASSISAEAIYDDILKPELTLDAPVSSGNDITLSLSQRIEYIADHIVSSYVGERSDEYLMLAMLDYSTGEIYALSQNNPDDKAVDYYAIEQALSSRDYTILKHNGGINIDTPDDFSGISSDRYIRVIYRSGFALVSSSSSKEMRDDALTEFETMLSL